MMDTREVAAYLRLKERRIYDLVRQRAIPHVRATGKLLFPRAQIDAWIAGKGVAPAAPAKPRPPIVAGSHDPLLEWSVRESRCGLAILAGGSRAGIDALARGDATAAATHWLDDASGEYNVPLVRETLGRRRYRRARMGTTHARLAAAAKAIRSGSARSRDLARKRLRDRDATTRAPAVIGCSPICWRKAASMPTRCSGSHARAHAETELAAIVRDGHADVGLGIEAAARANGLAFIPLTIERLDLVAFRRDVFEPPLQALLAWAREPAFAAQANALGGYDVARTGQVVFNG